MKLFAVLLILIGGTILITDIAQSLSGYNYYIEYDLANDGDVDYNGPISFTVDASGMIDGGYLQPDAADLAVTYLGGTEHITAMNLSSGSATWRFEYITIPPGAQAKKVMWMDNHLIDRDQWWIADDADVCTLLCPGSYNFGGTTPFAIQVDIEPACLPGTTQLIIGNEDSWRLELGHTGYIWSVKAGSGSVIHSVTIPATALTTKNVWAWYNGSEIVLSDGAHHASDDLPGGLVASGGTPSMAAADIIINDLRITTPGSAAAPTGGSPPPAGSSIYHLGPDPDVPLDTSYDCEECWGFSNTAHNLGSCGNLDVDPDYLANGVHHEHNSNGYGWLYCTDYGPNYEAMVTYVNDYPGSSGDVITGVSVTIAGIMEYVSQPDGYPNCQVVLDWVRLDDGNDTYNYNNIDTDLRGPVGETVYFWVNTGTRTLNLDGQPWTQADIDDLRIRYKFSDGLTLSDTDIHITELKLNVSYQ